MLMVRVLLFYNVYLVHSDRMHQLVDFRDFVSEDRQAEYKLYPYAKDVYYRPDGLISMTLEIYNDEQAHEFTFGFKCSDQLKRFLDRTIGDENEVQ